MLECDVDRTHDGISQASSSGMREGLQCPDANRNGMTDFHEHENDKPDLPTRIN